jgi:hypothetical protein
MWREKFLNWVYIWWKEIKEILKYFLNTYFDFWILSYWESFFFICLNAFHIIIAIALILFKYIILYLFIWQYIITIMVLCYEFFLYIKKIHNKEPQKKKLLKDIDINYVAYIKFLTKYWYKFCYYLIKYYIKLEKKEKNFFLIFFRWIFLITPFYWGTILFIVIIYFSIINCIFLLRIAIIDNNNWLIIFIYCIIDKFYKIIIFPVFNKIENTIIKIIDLGLANFLYNLGFGFLNNFLFKIKNYYFFIWIRWRRFYKFVRYKLIWLIKRKLFKKNIWIFRYKKFKNLYKYKFKLNLYLYKFKYNLYKYKFKLNLYLYKFFR